MEADGLQIQLDGLKEAVGLLFSVDSGMRPHVARAMFRCATRARDKSREYAPRSPTVGDIKKATGRKMKIRKARGTSRPKPGGLERSIDFRAGPDSGEIFISAGSEAGPYGFKMHEEKGQTWKNRGVGTISKGPKADDKFIERGIIDEIPAMFLIIQDEIQKAIKA